MRYRLVIFDFDGTLADSFGWFSRVFNEAAQAHGFRALDEAELEGLRYCDTREILKRLEIPARKLPSMMRFFRERMERDRGEIRLFEGVEELLRSLAEAGVVLAVVTSNSRANVEGVLGPKLTNLVRYFSCGSSLFGKHTKLHAVRRRARVEPGETVCIGDELRDLHAARKVGLPFGAVAWGYAHREVLEEHEPNAVFTIPKEIAEWVVEGA
jgi:phosphoglycolate phosphatase